MRPSTRIAKHRIAKQKIARPKKESKKLELRIFFWKKFAKKISIFLGFFEKKTRKTPWNFVQGELCYDPWVMEHD